VIRDGTDLAGREGVLYKKFDMADERQEFNSHKIMLGFIVRRCAAELGHPPTAEEFASWANNQSENGRRFSLFGQPISGEEAKVMLRHLGRLVTVRSPSVGKSGRADDR
jgi:hypothetical protein